MSELTFSNARIVLRHEVRRGSVLARDGLVASVDDGASAAAGTVDLEGDYLMPGAVELHTDNLERHLMPRPGVAWPFGAAIVAHDAEIAAAGITTVYDALRIGSLREEGVTVERVCRIADAIGRARDADALRAEHRVHLRVEVAIDDAGSDFERMAGHPLVGLVSVMDHTPGQRQFVTETKYREYYAGRYGMSEADIDAHISEMKALQARNSEANRQAVVAECRRRGLALASHDDATLAHVAEAACDGAAIAEFPTTVEAAAACGAHGLKVMMGAPNVVRGGSHSGNVSAGELAARGHLDILSSDYVPGSLLQAVKRLIGEVEGIDLPHAVASISAVPAVAAGLDDRGEIAAGKRADLLQVRDIGDSMVVRAAWRQGRRIL